MLVVENIHAGYGTSEVLVGVSLAVAPGAVVALIGANGAGKTTTMRAVSGLIRPSKGRVLLDGQPVQGLPASRIARMGLAHSPEGRKVFGPLSVEDNLLLGAYGRLPRFVGFHAKAAPDLERVYGLFPRLKERRRQLAGTLSGGEQQMLAIGRALMTNPRLLILDEATEGLAPLIREEIWNCLSMLKARGQSVLVIDKNVENLTRIADRHYIIERGRAVWSGTSEQLIAEPDLQHRYLGI
jgi:branched-chain amino acid transport system ATP-binding protein